MLIGSEMMQRIFSWTKMSWPDTENIKQDSIIIKVNFFLTSSLKIITVFPTELEGESSLHMVRIRFNTFSLDKITKDIKMDWFDKVSHFGGTAGLFNGFTIISLFELFIFLLTGVLDCLTLLIQFCKCGKNKVEQSNIVMVEEFQSKERKETNDHIEKKLAMMNQDFEALLNKKDACMKNLKKKVTVDGVEDIIIREKLYKK